MTKFEDFGFKAEIVDALKEIGFDEPFPIQEAAMPHMINGEDVIGQAHTGTGKTAAFALPILNKIESGHNMMRPIKALIIVPTRELAIQVCDEIKKFSKYSGHKCMPVYGGQSFQGQLDALRWGKDVVVATPGRLMDFMNKKLIDLSNVEFVILDEADRMLDMGFIDDIRFIMKSLPAKRQVALFSATMPPEIMRLTSEHMKDPVKVLIDADDLSGENIQQEYLIVHQKEKFHHLSEMLNKNDKTIIFCSTKFGARRLSKDLYRAGFSTVEIHGDLSQNQREDAIRKFKSGMRNILVATDVAARGLDIPRVEHVINYDVPNDPMAYFHRIGRTARAGASGRALTFVSEESIEMFEDVLKHTKVVIKRLNEEMGIVFHPSMAPGAKRERRHEHYERREPSRHFGGQGRGFRPHVRGGFRGRGGSRRGNRKFGNRRR